MELTGRGFYGEINVLIFLKKLNGNTDLVLSASDLYEFYLYLDSLESSLRSSVADPLKVIQSIFNKVYSEEELLMTNTISIGNHMSLNLSSEYGVTLFEALSCTMKSLCLKLQALGIEQDGDAEDDDDDDDDDDDESMKSVMVHSLDSEKEYITNCALILWDIIKLLLKYRIRVYHRESDCERISYYPITILYESFLILFEDDPFRGDVMDRYLALILNSMDLDAMRLCRDDEKLKNGKHPNHAIEAEYFMPSILTITGDPGIVLCDFWFGGAFPTKSEYDEGGEYDGCPSPEMVISLWFRGFDPISFAFASEDIITEYDFMDMVRNRISAISEIWSLREMHRYGHCLVVYLWVFKMMYGVIQRRFMNLMRVYLEEWPSKALRTLSEYHLGLELNAAPHQIWKDEELTYYAMLSLFEIRSDWKSWIATKILPELSTKNLSLVKRVTDSERFPEKFISQIFVSF